MKIKKGTPLIDQHDKSGFWDGKFGGSYIPETLKKPVEDLTNLFEKLRKDKKFIQERDYYYTNWVHKGPTPFIKLENLTNYLGGAQVWAKVVSEARGGAHKIYGAITAAMLCKAMGKKFLVTDTGAGYNGKMFSIAGKHFGLNVKVFIGIKDFLRQT